MYLVPAEEYHTPAKKGRPPRRRTKQHHHTEWIMLRTKHREAELRRNARTKEIADYMKQILPAVTNPQTPTTDTELPTLKAKCRRGTQSDFTTASFTVTHVRLSKEIIYWATKHEQSYRIMMMIMLTRLSRRTQRGSVEKT